MSFKPPFARMRAIHAGITQESGAEPASDPVADATKHDEAAADGQPQGAESGGVDSGDSVVVVQPALDVVDPIVVAEASDGEAPVAVETASEGEAPVAVETASEGKAPVVKEHAKKTIIKKGKKIVE